eukprot:g8470.t1
MSASSRGAFIVFEGIDCSGKSLQSKKLFQSLTEMKIPTELMRFPDRSTPIGSLLNEYLSGSDSSPDEIVHLLFAINRLEKRSSLEAKLASGVTVLADRYAYSGVAYSVAKGVTGLDKTWCQQIERGKIPKPDLVFYMDISVEAASARAGFGIERYEKTSFQESVKEVFKKLMEDEEWMRLDAERKQEDIANEVLELSLKEIEACSKGKWIRKIWTE